MTLRPILASFIYKQSWSRGSVGIPEGFPRPVGAVVNQLLAFNSLISLKWIKSQS